MKKLVLCLLVMFSMTLVFACDRGQQTAAPAATESAAPAGDQDSAAPATEDGAAAEPAAESAAE